MTIFLSNGLECLVSEEDFERLSRFSWGTIGKKQKYAARGTRKKGFKYRKILMHREILPVSDNLMVDHINGNTLDNRRENLRIVTRAKNLQNSKLRADSNCNYKGVSRKISKVGTVRFNARIQIAPNNRLFLGYFKTEIEAAKAYNDAAILHFGEYAKLNVLDN